jgi:hypothetical protein
LIDVSLYCHTQYSLAYEKKRASIYLYPLGIWQEQNKAFIS